MTKIFKSLLAGSALVALATPSLADTKSGVDAWERGDFNAAVAEWRPLAIKGEADAQFNMGQAYRFGRGVPSDLRQAESWYRRAATQGHFQAEDNLALLMFQNGQQREAMPIIERSANRGEPRAQFVYGTALFNGDLIKADWPRAYAYMTRASAAGMSRASTALAQMDQHVPLEQRQQGLSIARQLEADSRRAQFAQAAPLPAPAQAPIVPVSRPKVAMADPVAQPVPMSSAPAYPAPAYPTQAYPMPAPSNPYADNSSAYPVQPSAAPVPIKAPKTTRSSAGQFPSRPGALPSPRSARPSAPVDMAPPAPPVPSTPNWGAPPAPPVGQYPNMPQRPSYPNQQGYPQQPSVGQYPNMSQTGYPAQPPVGQYPNMPQQGYPAQSGYPQDPAAGYPSPGTTGSSYPAQQAYPAVPTPQEAYPTSQEVYAPKAKPKPRFVSQPRPVARPTKAVVRPAVAPTYAGNGGGWRVQLGAFSAPNGAQSTWQSLKGRIPALAGKQPYLVKAGGITRLQAGSYPSRGAADAACASVRSAGAGCMVVSN